VVVSNDTGNRHAPVVEVVYLTTKRKTEIPTHVYINSAERPSIALCEQIVTVCKSRLERYMGSVTVAEMRRIDRALTTSLGIKHKTGGDAMKLTMVTPYGEMNFDMEADKVSELVQRAFQYAAGGQHTEKDAGVALTTPQVAQEQPKPQRIENKPHRRVDSLFGDFRGQKQGDQKQETREPEEYRGFLLIKCKHCGKLKGFCAKNGITEYTCECGEKTELHDLKPAFLRCKCGGNYKYKTNVTDERFDYNCLNCGSPVDMGLNSRRNTYVTI
jgi:mRNA-degrading endonuclease toxin of MazEF toxin-antitoxin module